MAGTVHLHAPARQRDLENRDGVFVWNPCDRASQPLTSRQISNQRYHEARNLESVLEISSFESERHFDVHNPVANGANKPTRTD